MLACAHLKKMDPLIFAVITSLFFSLWCAYGFFINPDGIIYINFAQFISFDTSLLEHPLRVNLPFYSLLIKLVHQVTPFSWENAALFTNALLMALLIAGYIQIIKVLGGSTLTCWIAAAVILTHPELNYFRAYIIRDIGFWALLYWNLYALIKYQQTNLLRYIVLWYIVAVGAALFRVEGFVLAGLGPLFLVFSSGISSSERIKRIVLFYGFELLALISVSLVVIFSGKYFGIIDHLTSLFNYWFDYITLGFVANWKEMTSRVLTSMPRFFQASYINVFFLGGLIAYFLLRLINMFYPLHAILFLYGVRKKCFPGGFAASWRLISYWGFLTLFIAAIFLTKMVFLSGRYVFPACLIGLIVIPFTVEFLYRKYEFSFWKKYPRLNIILAVLLMLGLLLSGLVSFGYSKEYMKQASAWIKDNTPENSSLYTNSVQIAFYAERQGENWKESTADLPIIDVLSTNAWRHYDYLGIAVKKREKDLLQLMPTSLQMQPVAQFSNKRGDTVYVFKVGH